MSFDAARVCRRRIRGDSVSPLQRLRTERLRRSPLLVHRIRRRRADQATFWLAKTIRPLRVSCRRALRTCYAVFPMIIRVRCSNSASAVDVGSFNVDIRYDLSALAPADSYRVGGGTEERQCERRIIFGCVPAPSRLHAPDRARAAGLGAQLYCTTGLNREMCGARVQKETGVPRRLQSQIPCGVGRYRAELACVIVSGLYRDASRASSVRFPRNKQPLLCPRGAYCQRRGDKFHSCPAGSDTAKTSD